MAQPEGGLLMPHQLPLMAPENYLNQDDSGNGQTGKKRRHCFSRLDPPLETGETVAN